MKSYLPESFIRAVLLAGLPFCYQPGLGAQEAAPPPEEEVIEELNPFVVTDEGTSGYTAVSTLAGTRIRTDLRDLANPLQVITEQFLQDTAVKRTEDLLVYTTNTEVGGIYGNFSGVGNTQGANEGNNLLRPHTNTRVRGLDSADNTRNFFLSDIPWDSYIVDRVDIQRGPNSILFGLGSPAGIVNSSLMGANFTTGGKVENVLDTMGSVRFSLNYNREVMDELLAVRVAALDDNQKYKQEPAYQRDKRLYGAVVYQPRLFGEKHGRLVINANVEVGDQTANRPRMLPPTDQITPFWTGLNRQVFDPAWAWSSGAMIDRGNPSKAALNRQVNEPWLGNEQDAITGNAAAMFFNNGESQPFLVQSAGAATNFGLKSDGTIDRGIAGYVFGRRVDIAGFNEYSLNANADDPNVLPAANKNFYKDKSLRDPSVFDFYSNLIDGENKEEWADWTAYNVAVSQTFFENRLGLEFVYDYQELERGRESIFGGSTFLSVDINTHTNNIPTEYGVAASWPNAWPTPSTVTGGERNPNVGRAYISGSGANGFEEDIIRENYRLTAFGTFYGSDFFDDESFLAKLIGRNVITGLLSREDRSFANKDWNLWASDINYAQRQDLPIGITEYPRRVPYAIYLSGDLRNTASPVGLNLDRVRSTINPSGQFLVNYFDSHWKHPLTPGAAGYVDPAAAYALPWDGAASTQSENWRNYAGWTTMQMEVLNSRNGDIADLYRNATKRNEKLDSYGFTYQGYFWDGLVVPTVGWRHDEIETWGSTGPRAPGTSVISPEFDNPKTATNVVSSEGDTLSWGVVAHSPRSLNEKMRGMRVSAFYNSSENFRADNRIGFGTLPLPNPKGTSTDYGAMITTPDNKYSFKVTYFTTEVTDANIPGGNPLGSNSWFLNMMEAWGTAAALTHEMYWAGELPGRGWYSNYGMVDDNRWGQAGWENAPFSAEALNHPANVKLFAAVADWYKTMPQQYVFDNYGLAINRAAAQGTYADRKAKMVQGGAWNPYNGIGSIQSTGTIGGLSPTGTIDQESKGWEFEFTARPIKGLDLAINAAKTTAQRTSLGSEFVQYIEAQKKRLDGPAGDMRLWWGGDPTFRKYYDDFIYQPYLFQLDANGSDAAEIRPWRFNLVGNYSIQEGFARGANIGLGYRWQDEVILGYELDSTKTKLDIDSPIRGAAEDAFDLWMGYTFKVNDKLNWRVQLNVRNLLQDESLIPVSVNPDGEVATYRIMDGERWMLTNSISF